MKQGTRIRIVDGPHAGHEEVLPILIPSIGGECIDDDLPYAHYWLWKMEDGVALFSCEKRHPRFQGMNDAPATRTRTEYEDGPFGPRPVVVEERWNGHGEWRPIRKI